MATTLTPDRLTDAYMAQVTSVRDRVLAYASAMWIGAPQLRDEDIDRLVSRIVPAVRGGQVQVATITNAYVERLAALDGVAVARVAVDANSVIDYRGVPAEEVYRRPAVATYAALGGGKPFDAARKEGLNRLRSIVSTDIQQTRNRQARAAYSESGFEYTLRVLSGAENCALCVIASTQRYLANDLQPMHPGCDCGQRGIRAAQDPGQIIDPDLLELTYAAIEAKVGATDRSARLLTGENPVSDFLDLIVTREHGELGPTLAWRNDRFTGPNDLH